MGQTLKPYPVEQSTGHWNPLPERSVAELKTSLNAALPELLNGDSQTLQTTLELVEHYELDGSALPNEQLASLAAHQMLSGTARAKALELLLSRHPADAETITLSYATDPKDEVASLALKQLARLNPAFTLTELRKAVIQGSAHRQQAVWSSLAQLRGNGVEKLFLEQLAALEGSKGVSPAALELMEAAAARSEESVKSALVHLQQTLGRGEDPLSK